MTCVSFTIGERDNLAIRRVSLDACVRRRLYRLMVAFRRGHE